MKLVAELSDQYQPRHYVVADTDAMSSDKLYTMEKNRAQYKGDSLVCYIFFLSASRWLKLVGGIMSVCVVRIYCHTLYNVLVLYEYTFLYLL